MASSGGCKADDLLHLEADKSSNMSDNAGAKTSCSNHEDREEKIDEQEEDSCGGSGQGRQRRELSIKNKEVLNSSRAQANNSRAATKGSDSGTRSKKGQQKKRKSDEEGSKTEEIGLKMRIKRKKMATRQSKAKREEVEAEADSPLSTTASSPSPLHHDESIITEERRGANKEKKRKLSCSSSTPGGKGLVSAKPTSFSSCQHRARKRSSLTMSSSSAPASPAAEPVLIRSRRSSPPIMSSSVGDSPIDTTPASPTEMEGDQVPANKKLKIDPNREEDHGQNQEKPIPSLISATLSTLVPVSREKSEQHDAGTWVRTIGTITEAECFGPCEPGTSVTLEGIVWNETKGGILVVNVTWRGKTYVGTLLDCTKYDWAPPQSCDSPSSNENDSAGHWSSWGHANHRKSGHATSGNGRGRKGQTGNRADAKRQQQHGNQQPNGSGSNESSSEQDQNQERIKKAPPVSGTTLEAEAPILFQCPFGSCEKKFSAVVGLKYHQTTSHKNVTCKMADKHLNHFSLGSGSKIAQEKKPKADGEAGAKSMDVKPNLDELFKSAQAKTSGQGQDQQQTNSPVYSDISEDDGVTAPPLQPIMDDTIVPAVIPQLAPAALTEKPMAIVEPQCAPSASTSNRPAPIEQRSAPTLAAPKSGQIATKISRESDGSHDKFESVVCPPLLPSLETNSLHKKPGSISKFEPGSPRPTSRALEFAVPAPPPSASGMGPSSSPLPVPMSMAHPGRPSPGASQHPMNMINQLNHPAFMFNPFNPSNAAMFPGGQMVPQSVFQSQALGLDPTAAAAAASLMAAGQQSAAAGMYGSPAALAAAAGFPMGLHSPPGSHPGSMALFGGSPMVSMAPGFGSSNLSLPHSAAMQLGPSAAFQSQSPSLAAASRLQQAHKIHELTEHAKRVHSAAGDTSVIVEALRRSQVANISPSPSISNVQSQRARQVTPASADTESGQRSVPSLTSGKASTTPSSTSVPTSVIASSIGCDTYGSPKSANPGTATPGMESSKQQQGPLSAKVASSNSRTGLLSVSPPVQRHLHTHHHTHTTYPALLAPAIDPYSAIVASQQAAAAAAAVGGYPFGSSTKS